MTNSGQYKQCCDSKASFPQIPEIPTLRVCICSIANTTPGFLITGSQMEFLTDTFWSYLKAIYIPNIPTYPWISAQGKPPWESLPWSQRTVCIHPQRPLFLSFRKLILGTFLVAQWLRICLPTQGTRVWYLVRELDPTCMQQLRVCMPLSRLWAATKTWHNQNK